jgi:hypothetical protein
MAAARFIRTWILLLTVRGSLCRAYKDLSCSQGTGADVAVVVAVALLSDRHLLDQRVWWRAGQSLHLDPLFPLRRIARKHMQQLHLSKPRIDGRGPCDAAAEVPLDGIGCQHSMTDARGCHVPWIMQWRDFNVAETVVKRKARPPQNRAMAAPCSFHKRFVEQSC